MQLLATMELLSESEMQNCAALLANQLTKGDIITFSGEVGAGKTTFARAVIAAIARETAQVTSPTFTVMQSYEVRINQDISVLWHLDLYRLNHANEAESLGLCDLWEQTILIEWPEIIDHLLPSEHLNIRFQMDAQGESRTLFFYGNDAWRARVSRLKCAK